MHLLSYVSNLCDLPSNQFVQPCVFLPTPIVFYTLSVCMCVLINETRRAFSMTKKNLNFCVVIRMFF